MPKSDGLTPKQAAFVKQYVVDFNATKAALRAGYSHHSAHSIGYENLKKPEIQRAVAIEAKRRAEAVEVTAENVIRELGRIGFSNMQDYMVVGPDGMPRLDWRSLTREQAAALREVTVDVIGHTLDPGAPAEYDDDGNEIEPELVPIHRVKFKLESKQAALEKLGRYFGIWKDKLEHSGSVKLQGARAEHELTDDELEALARSRLDDAAGNAE